MRTTNKGWPILVDGKLFAYDKKVLGMMGLPQMATPTWVQRSSVTTSTVRPQRWDKAESTSVT